MAGMANALKTCWSFAFVSILTLGACVALYRLAANWRHHLAPAAMFAVWVSIMFANLGEDLRWALTPRGHYYSIEYRNRSNNDVFVDGVGDLRAADNSNSGINIVYRLPERIVWWEGSDYRKAKSSDKSIAITKPRGLNYGERVVFKLNKAGVWETSIE